MEAGSAPSARLTTIVVGVDGSGAATTAIRWAAERASEVGAEVVLVHAIDPDTQFWRDLPPSGLSSWRSRLRRQLRTEWADPLGTAGVAYRTEMVEADPATALSSVALKEGAELIVVGAHGTGRLSDRFHGSVSGRLIHHGHHPITVVPEDWCTQDVTPSDQQRAAVDGAGLAEP